MSKREYNDEFKREAVRLATSGAKSIAQTARELGVNENTLYAWVKLFGPRREGEPEPLTPEERRELIQLRRENRRLQEERDILKRAVGIFFWGTAMRYQFIREHRKQFRVSSMCQVLGVSRSGYHAWLGRPQSQRARGNAELLEEIREIHEGSRGRYGSPRVHAVLRRRGKRCGRHRVARLMRQNGLGVRHKRRYRVTTDSKHNLPVAENLLDRQFAVGTANRAWVADLTYIATAEGWLYLAAVLDLGTRRVVGWSMATTMACSLVKDALELAIRRRRPGGGLIHHSDRGSQYASHSYQGLLKEHGMLPSMSRKGDCWDNATMESFFHTLKTELIGNGIFRTREEARREIFAFIEVWYNRQRLHSALGYRTPEEYESLAKAV